jgi:thiol-disulfide isomerase/thioredoxin
MTKSNSRTVRTFWLGTMVLLTALIGQSRSPVFPKNIEVSLKFYERMIDGLDDKQQKLSNWHGKIVVANFWASWCGPCQYEIPRFMKWQHEYGPKGLQIVGIGLDDTKKLQNVARSLDIDYPLLVMSLDKGRSLLSRFGNKEMIIPFTLIFNRDGTIVYKHKGLMGQDEFDIMIAPLL